ncbi:MAG: DMT family transporter [Pseudomonadales bacterium]|mgnify:FL=1|nr:DMT family transporter [Pseudomonadales bacterium]MDP6317537.1 DMT family transporter [Pseudomonadales bacterium]MDP7576961.1 DMT family transporter [Pseudomonadales bacterium]HJP52969.1 DMT family transporter [Pseudomonadales bacterium]
MSRSDETQGLLRTNLITGAQMSDSNKAYLYALTTVLFWSTVATAFKVALSYLDIFQLVFYASLTSAFILVVPVIARGQIKALWITLRTHWKISLIASCLNPLIYYIVLFAAYDRLPAQVAQPINYTWAIVLTMMSMVFLKQRPTGSDFLAAIICYAGVIIIATRGQFTDFQVVDGFGLLLALFSTFIWSGYWILNMKDPRDHQYAMCLNFLTAVPIALTVCLAFSSLDVSFEGIASAVYVGVFEMGLAFLFWSRALRLAENTTRVSTLVFLSPFLSLFFIHQILGESIYASTYVGLVVIVTGLLIQKTFSQPIST